MWGLCMKIASTRVRVRSPSQNYKKPNESFKRALNFSDDHSFNSVLSAQESHEYEAGNRVMVVIDSNDPETKEALEWALSHTVLAHDTIVLLYVTKQAGEHNKGQNHDDQRAFNHLRSAKNICQQRKPEVKVEMAIREGNVKKGEIIVEEAKRRRASLLVLGHRKQSILRRLKMFYWKSNKKLMRRSTGTTKVADYCIKNANCMTVAVRRKSRRYGGYLITISTSFGFLLSRIRSHAHSL